MSEKKIVNITPKMIRGLEGRYLEEYQSGSETHILGWVKLNHCSLGDDGFLILEGTPFAPMHEESATRGYRGREHVMSVDGDTLFIRNFENNLLFKVIPREILETRFKGDEAIEREKIAPATTLVSKVQADRATALRQAVTLLNSEISQAVREGVKVQVMLDKFTTVPSVSVSLSVMIEESL